MGSSRRQRRAGDVSPRARVPAVLSPYAIDSTRAAKPPSPRSTPSAGPMPAWTGSCVPGDDFVADTTGSLTVRNNCCGSIVASPWFHAFVALVIIFNAVDVAVETDLKDPSDGTLGVWYGVELAIAVLFGLEMVIKIVGYGTSTFIGDAWNVFDASITIIALADVMLLQPLFDDALARDIGRVTILRLVRLVPMIGALRSRHAVQQLFDVLAAVKGAAVRLLWLCLLLVMAAMVFAVLMTRVVGHYSAWNDDTEHTMWLLDAQVEDLFATVPRSMLTLLQFVTLDGWGFITRALMQELPLLWIVCVLWIVVVSLPFLGAVVAVLVQSMLSVAQAVADRAQSANDTANAQRKATVLRLLRGFDYNNTGFLHTDEIMDALKDPKLPIRDYFAHVLPQDVAVDDFVAIFCAAVDHGNVQYEKLVSAAFYSTRDARLLDMQLQRNDHRKDIRALQDDILRLQRSVDMAIARQDPARAGALVPDQSSSRHRSSHGSHGSHGSRSRSRDKDRGRDRDRDRDRDRSGSGSGGGASYTDSLSIQRLAKSGYDVEKIMKGRGNSGFAHLPSASPRRDSDDVVGAPGALKLSKRKKRSKSSKHRHRHKSR